MIYAILLAIAFGTNCLVGPKDVKGLAGQPQDFLGVRAPVFALIAALAVVGSTTRFPGNEPMSRWFPQMLIGLIGALSAGAAAPAWVWFGTATLGDLWPYLGTLALIFLVLVGLFLISGLFGLKSHRNPSQNRELDGDEA